MMKWSLPASPLGDSRPSISEYYVTPDDLVRSIPLVAASYDQPFGNSSALPAYYCAKMAKEDGITRILAGDGGNELFGGNSRYAKQRVFDWYQYLPGATRQLIIEPLLKPRPLERYRWHKSIQLCGAGQYSDA